MVRIIKSMKVKLNHKLVKFLNNNKSHEIAIYTKKHLRNIRSIHINYVIPKHIGQWNDIESTDLHICISRQRIKFRSIYLPTWVVRFFLFIFLFTVFYTNVWMYIIQHKHNFLEISSWSAGFYKDELKFAFCSTVLISSCYKKNHTLE